MKRSTQQVMDNRYKERVRNAIRNCTHFSWKTYTDKYGNIMCRFCGRKIGRKEKLFLSLLKEEKLRLEQELRRTQDAISVFTNY